ncbi:hypothetical protein [Polyangium aurulentum]|uniref:hypothetical protein n=1 Tax=Polyangium aurulentum TaxID=2567896 RepID=UPI0010AE494A|nr:hypothetical protein [Polyangium aurulentum]UQA61379.1 hypothetical protein E8A73_013245 [Polyangium aurulentum]
MSHRQHRTSHACRFVVPAALAAVAGLGCGSVDPLDQEPAEAMEAEQGTAEAVSAYTANTKCSTTGGGTWGAILKMCVSIWSSGDGKFTVTKSDGTYFGSAGTMYLKVGTYEPWGVNHASKTISGGSLTPEISLSDWFGQWQDYPKQYYARWESQAGGYAWVGPITIYQ